MFEEKMTNCPQCRKPILKKGVFSSPVQFDMRCPWCQTNLKVTIEAKIVTQIISTPAEEKIAQLGNNFTNI